jgi:hypothetical protein
MNRKPKVHSEQVECVRFHDSEKGGESEPINQLSKVFDFGALEFQ